jgi:hypothetical protein
MKHFSGGLLVVVIALVVGVSTADALVLCANASGSVVALERCKAGMTQLDPAAVGLVGPPGAQGPGGATGTRGPSDAFVGDNFSTGGAPVALSANAGSPTTILALALPAGSYVVQAVVGLHADIVGGTLVPFSNIQCSFADSSGPFGADSRTLIGGSTQSAASVPLLAALTLGAPNTVSVVCSTDGALEVFTRASTVTAVQVETLAGP